MADWQLKILYDGACPLCRSEVRWLRRHNDRERLAFEDISRAGFRPDAYGLTHAQVNARLHGMLPDGTVVRGFDVTRYTYRTIGLGWIVAPTDWPVLRPLLDALYLLFARYRHRIGRLFGRRCVQGVCELPRREI